MRNVISTLVAVLFVCSIASLPEVRAGVGDDVAHMTIYNAGIVQFVEERTIQMQTGLNTVEWRSLMPKAYLRTLRVVADGADVVRQDITYDGTDVQGQKSPVLHLVVENKGTAGPRRVRVDYLAPGVRWENDFSLVLDQPANGGPPTTASLDSWVSVYNTTGADLSASMVDLVAGDVSLLVAPGGGRGNLVAQQMANTVGFDDDESDAPAEASAEVGSLSVFSRFTLGRDISLNANTPVNRFPLFQRAKLTVEERKVFENGSNVQTFGRGGFTLLPTGLEVRLVAKNTTGVPMPAGQVTIYARTGDLAQIVGQDSVGLTAKDAEFSVSQGRSNTLLGTRRIVERREVEIGVQNNVMRKKLVTTVEVEITNRGPVAAEAYIRDGVESYGDNKWTVLDSSHESIRLGANMLQFRVQVPPGGKTKVAYTVETR